MTSSIVLAQKRLDIAYNEVERFTGLISCAFLSGSVVYAPNTCVTEKSDVDIVFVASDIKKSIDLLIEDADIKKQEGDRQALRDQRTFQGYCVKRSVNGVLVSIHLLREDAMDVVCKCEVGNLRLYRDSRKSEDYVLHGFSGQTYNYWVKNVPLEDLSGGRTIVPISFKYNDRYYMGIHRDKLLSAPKILVDSQRFLKRRIDKLWDVVAEELYTESMRIMGKVDLSRMSVLRAMAKKEKFEEHVVRHIEMRTQQAIKKIVR